MFSRKEKLKQSSPAHNDGDKHSNSAKQLNGECKEQAETAMEQGAPLEKGEAKSSALPHLNAEVASVGHLPSHCINRVYKRKHFDVLLAESMVASAAGHETELLPVEEPPLKFEGNPRKRKGRPRRQNIRTLNDLYAGSSISGSDDQPWSMLFGFHCPNPTTVDDPRHSSPSDVSQVDVVQKKNKANEGTPPPPSSSNSNSNSNSSKTIQSNGSSPFMKRSPIWNAIESMQVFHKFPQNPHFLPLLDLKEDSREGLAIGHMVNFANVAEKAFKLKITQDFTTCLETLQDLEPHGFDVTAVRDHLKKMLSIKEAQPKLREKKTQLENRMLELTHEHSEIDKEIVEFNEKMKRVQEKLTSAKSKKGEKLSEIVFLKGKSGSISQLIDGASHNMEDLAEYYLKLAAFLP